MPEYNHTEDSKYTEGEVAASVGKRARLPFTGEIVGYEVTAGGVAAWFRIDERWGFGEAYDILLDLDALVLDEETLVDEGSQFDNPKPLGLFG